MDEPTRRAWSKPELIVIVRSGPEEAVLTACKKFSAEMAGPTSYREGCEGTQPQYCNACPLQTTT
jgi:hypothetical protein